MRDKIIWLPSRVRWHLLVLGDAVDKDKTSGGDIIKSITDTDPRDGEEDKRKLGPVLRQSASVKASDSLKCHLCSCRPGMVIITSQDYPCLVDSVVCFVWFDWLVNNLVQLLTVVPFFVTWYHFPTIFPKSPIREISLVSPNSTNCIHRTIIQD